MIDGKNALGMQSVEKNSAHESLRACALNNARRRLQANTLVSIRVGVQPALVVVSLDHRRAGQEQTREIEVVPEIYAGAVIYNCD